MAYLYIGASVLAPISVLAVMAFMSIKGDMDDNGWS
jgi:hypothetical protein